MANGMPIAALVGKKKYMRAVDDIFYSFTFGGECLSLAAAVATIREMEKKKVIPYLWHLGQILKDRTNMLVAHYKLGDIISVVGKPPWQIFLISSTDSVSDLEIKSYIQQELLKKGFLWFGQHNISFTHTKKDVNNLLDAYDKIFGRMKVLLENNSLKSSLEGKPITNIFKVR